MAKYHKGNTIRCTYSPEFRGLVYKINPHDMSCMYKNMFEMCSTNKLRDLDEMSHEEFITILDPKHQPLTETFYDEIDRWKVCDKTHKWLPDITNSLLNNRGCSHKSSAFKSRSQSAFAKLENHSIKDDRLKLNSNKIVNLPCRKTFSTDAVGSRPYEYRLISPHLSSLYCSGSTHIPYTFHHYLLYSDHIDQYREEYTQRRLKSLRSNINDNRCYNGVLSAPQILQRPKLKPSTTQTTFTPNSVVKCLDVFDNIRDAPVSTNYLQPSQKRSVKKKILKSQAIQKNNKHQQQPNQPVLEVQCQQRLAIKSEDGSSYDKMLTTESLIPEPEINHRLPCTTLNTKLPVSFRTRPTIPSKSHNSSHDQPSYVVTYLRK